MGRKRRGPWLRSQDRCWYTTVGRKSVRLGSADQPYDEIERAYHSLLASPKQSGPLTVSRIKDRFLENLRRSRAASTYDWYKGHLDRCIAFCGPSRAPDEVSGDLVDRWLATDYPNASETTKHGAARTIVRLMNWALAERLIDRSPLVGYAKPTPRSRESYVTPEQYATCLEHATSPFKELIVFLWETGCRPQEARIIEAAWIDGQQIVFPTEQSKGKRRRRVVYLNARATEIARRLAAEYPDGPIFRNGVGRPWTKDAINCAFVRLRKKTGIDCLCAYAFRHGFATAALKRGIDTTTVGVLMGHANPGMVAQVYQHLAGDPTYLLAVVEQPKSDSSSRPS